ncbi:cytochrome P450 [soil metagenome]
MTSLTLLDVEGGLPDVPFIDLFDARSAPLAFLRRTSARYGDLYRYALDGWPAVVINDPVMARKALQGDGETLGKEGTPDLMMLRPMLGRGLMTNEGEAWRLSRAAAQPSFAAGAVEGYATGMLERIDVMLERWRAATAPVLDLEQEFSRLTLEVVGDCLFSTDFDQSHVDLGRSVEVMNRCVAHFDPTDREQPARFARAHGDLHALMQSIIDTRKTHGGDLLAALEARCAAEPLDPARALRDEIVTFVMAGHETTAKALTWSLHLLALHPRIEARVRSEARAAFAAGGDVSASDLPYAWQVIQEVMRLYPPVWLMSRRATRAMTLGGATVPEGVLVIVSPYLLHRHPDHWTDPEVFDPDRFAPRRAPREAGAYMPFGAGHRVCIGRLFAAAETTLALAKTVAAFSCRHVGDLAVEPEALVTLRPRGGLPMTVSPAP